MIRWASLLAACFLVAACSSGPDTAGASKTTYRLIVDRIGALVRGPQGPAPFGVTRAGIADYPDPLLVATIENGTRAGLVWQGRNGPFARWQTLDGIGFVTRSGVLTATRGFGDDLLSVEAGEVAALVTARKEGRALRIERRLDGENDIVKQPFICAIVDKGAETIEVFEIRHATRRLTETCRPETADPRVMAFENTYWVGASGTVWRSDQRIGPAAGRVILEQLIE